MKKIIRLTESDLARIVKRVIKEESLFNSDEEEGKPLKGCITVIERKTKPNFGGKSGDWFISKDNSIYIESGEGGMFKNNEELKLKLSPQYFKSVVGDKKSGIYDVNPKDPTQFCFR
jgi:hypothetical protein